MHLDVRSIVQQISSSNPGGTTGKARTKREIRDFLVAVDHEGHRLDFHALRHTCGAWLATQGENPKTIQTIMRHSSITLTIDTYGHLFPASKSDAIHRMGRENFCG
ncbi:tyrosine-type recombinase/integrase [Stieleria sp. TO1_6]|uniref:tyrosine-type recombinase/integrase n=1 Tax=Stieleria tagensis TaxID=2956795 RepID=UPI00209B8686|nr:tyrosine-type recombinase/integrase [Stieleria tagensis]MCO8123983.1 tyrosine-type recombinase/integrase [Stieleria tagensis]